MEKTDKTYTAWGIDDGVHEARDLKPMLTPEEQVTLLKAKGVTFERCTEAEAIVALTERDSFLHIASYRKLFQVHQRGENAGKYVRLDFADLLDLNDLDCEMHRVFLAVSNDVERVAKIRLVTRIANNPREDGYGIVADFMLDQRRAYRESITRNLYARAISPESADVYTGRLIEHYRYAMPVWVFLEVVPFGTLLAFMLFCAHRWGDKNLEDRHYELTSVKAVRNCCAHQSCIVNGFADESRSPHAARYRVLEWLARSNIGSAKTRKAKMGNKAMQQLVTTLSAFDTIEDRENTHAWKSLSGLSDSLRGCARRYGEQNTFVSFLSFLAKAIDATLKV